MNKILRSTCVVVAALWLQACSDDVELPTVESPPPQQPAPEPEPTTIVDVAVADGNFTTLVAALQATGLDETLADANSTFTVFAPTDAAFALLGDATISGLLEDTETLSGILTYHVVSGAVDAAAAIASAGMTVETVNGAPLALSLSGENLLVNTVTVTATDIQTDNGIIHVIDAVLLPPAEVGTPSANIVDTAVADGNFTTLVAALEATDLVDTLASADGQFTVFAPTDAAFASIAGSTISALLADPDALRQILLQHVIDGQVDSVTAFTLNGTNATTLGGDVAIGINTLTDTLTFGGATVTTTDIYTTNGVIHVIDTVVIGDAEVPAPSGSIVDVAVEAGSFTTLAAALEATDLIDTLANLDSTFTVFAPNDDAFAKLGEDTINALLADPDTLRDILLYHVFPGAAVLQDGAVTIAQSGNNQIAMANEDNAALSRSGASLFINQSVVSAANITAANGVIHVIDQVILPPADRGTPTVNIAEAAVADEQFSTLVAALTAADLVDTLSDPDASFTVFAPTNAAFDKIDDDVLDGLLADVPALSTILLQHVVPAEVNSVAAYAANGANVTTAAENSITVGLVDFRAVENTMTSLVTFDDANDRLVGGMGADQAGFTLYTFDSDLGTSGSACNEDCAESWPPLLAGEGTMPSFPGTGTVARDDGTSQVTYLGRPLYFFANDTAAGDAAGQGVNDVWFTVDLPEVSLQIEGSNVTTPDVYTTNGVIHIIDTVIVNVD